MHTHALLAKQYLNNPLTQIYMTEASKIFGCKTSGITHDTSQISITFLDMTTTRQVFTRCVCLRCVCLHDTVWIPDITYTQQLKQMLFDVIIDPHLLSRCHFSSSDSMCFCVSSVFLPQLSQIQSNILNECEHLVCMSIWIKKLRMKKRELGKRN